MSLTIAPSPFGSLLVSVAETGSTLSVTTVATSPSVLTMALGVPGPTGATGATGATGQGVAAGGTTGQALVKLSGTNYDTGWATISGGGGTWGSITGTLSNQTDLYNALNDKLSLSGGTMSGTIFLSSLRNLLNTDLTVTAYNDTGAGTNFVHTFDAFDGTFALATNGGGLKFPDATVQVTAGLPLTGGTMSGTLEFNIGSGAYTQINAEDGVFNYGPNGSTLLSQNGLEITGAGNGITFLDSSVQTTAFPPSGGTTSQFIDGTGALQTYGPLGDRYLTSSTSTLTCDSGNGKTMTVGTGLSYSRQQDITVSYSNSVHMHGTVLTYDSATGVMTFDSNTHSGSGTYSSWEVNVGGVAGAILPVGGTSGQVLAKINSTNFNTEWVSLGTMATEPASAYLSTASAVANYLTISSASSTYQTQSGMSAYLSTSAAASTYQTQSGMSAYLSTASAVANYLSISNAASTYLTQSSASSTYIAQTSFATSTQAQAGTSTTTVVSPATLLDAKYFQGGRYLTIGTWTAATSGAGAFGPATQGNIKNIFAPTSVVGYGLGYILNYNSGRGIASSIGADFSKRTTIGGRFIKTTTTADANSVFRFTFGKVSGVGAGDLASRGIGFRHVANGAIELQVHNGTTLYNVSSSFTPTANQSFDVVIVAESGTATLYVNGSSVATSANAPTVVLTSTVGTMQIEAQNTSALSGSAMTYSCSDFFVQTNL